MGPVRGKRVPKSPCFLRGLNEGVFPVFSKDLRARRYREFPCSFSGSPFPKHLLGQNFPSKGKLEGKFSLREKIFPPRENFPLKIAFPFPWNALFPPGNEGFGEEELVRLEGRILTFPREGRFISSHFFASKDVMGCFVAKNRAVLHEVPPTRLQLLR